MKTHCSDAEQSGNVGHKGINIPSIRSLAVDEQEGLAVASIVRDNSTTLPSDDPFPRAH